MSVSNQNFTVSGTISFLKASTRGACRLGVGDWGAGDEFHFSSAFEVITVRRPPPLRSVLSKYRRGGHSPIPTSRNNVSEVLSWLAHFSFNLF